MPRLTFTIYTNMAVQMADYWIILHQLYGLPYGLFVHAEQPEVRMLALLNQLRILSQLRNFEGIIEKAMLRACLNL